MPVARAEIAVISAQLRAHYAGLGDIRRRISTPSGNGLADQLGQSACHLGYDHFIQQRGH
jgi:hypothetical protein